MTMQGTVRQTEDRIPKTGDRKGEETVRYGLRVPGLTNAGNLVSCDLKLQLVANKLLNSKDACGNWRGSARAGVHWRKSARTGANWRKLARIGGKRRDRRGRAECFRRIARAGLFVAAFVGSEKENSGNFAAPESITCRISDAYRFWSRFQAVPNGFQWLPNRFQWLPNRFQWLPNGGEPVPYPARKRAICDWTN